MTNQKIKVAYLHNHTIYSEKDAIGTVYEYIKRIEDLNQKSSKYEIVGLQITEHGHMHTMTEAYGSCQEAGLINSPAMEAYHTVDLSVQDTHRYHMVLMAINEQGKRNLFTLATLAGFNKFKGRTKPFPRIDEKMIQQYGKGIIGLSACLGGQIPRLIEEGKYDEAKQKALNYSQWFEEFYLEVQPHTIPDQLMLNEALIRMSKETGIPLVITTDSHYVLKDDKQYHDILKKIDDPSGRMVFRTEAYMMSFEELETYCLEYDIPLEAIENTGKIIEKCRGVELKPKDSRGFMPTFPCPPGYTEETYLREITTDHLFKQMIQKKFPNFTERYKQLEYELDVICNQGFAGYFLILWDWFKWCRENDIIMGKGRGQMGLLTA